MRKRWTFAREFKTRVALNAAAGESTLAEPAAINVLRYRRELSEPARVRVIDEQCGR
jgi:hypothetical protein